MELAEFLTPVRLSHQICNVWYIENLSGSGRYEAGKAPHFMMAQTSRRNRHRCQGIHNHAHILALDE
jgi:hypothetical protein